jgi:hypothetical protein
MARGLDLTGQVWVLLFSQAIASVLFDLKNFFYCSKVFKTRQTFLKKCQARYP